MRTYRAIVQGIADRAAHKTRDVLSRRTIDDRELKRLNALMFRGLWPEFVAAYREGQRLAVELKRIAGAPVLTTHTPSGVKVNGLVDLAQREIDIEIDYRVALLRVQVERMRQLGMTDDNVVVSLRAGMADRVWNAFTNRVNRVVDNAIHLTADVGYYDSIGKQRAK